MSFSNGEIVVVFVALVGGVWLWRQATSSIARKVSQGVLLRRARQRGQARIRSRLEFVSELPPAEILDALLVRLDLPTGVQSTVSDRLYLDRADARHLAIVSGSRLRTGFTSALVLHDDLSGGTSGSYQVSTWSESHGIVRDTGRMLAAERQLFGALQAIGVEVATAVGPERVRWSVPRRVRRIELGHISAPRGLAEPVGALGAGS